MLKVEGLSGLIATLCGCSLPLELTLQWRIAIFRSYSKAHRVASSAAIVLFLDQFVRWTLPPGIKVAAQVTDYLSVEPSDLYIVRMTQFEIDTVEAAVVEHHARVGTSLLAPLLCVLHMLQQMGTV